MFQREKKLLDGSMVMSQLPPMRLELKRQNEKLSDCTLTVQDNLKINELKCGFCRPIMQPLLHMKKINSQ